MTDDRRKEVWPPCDYEVGYGRPPVKGRFAKGKSGNPRGRPRKAAPKTPTDHSIRDEYLAAAKSPVKLRNGDQVSELSMLEAIIKAQCAAALKGSTRAQKEVLERISEYRDQIAAEVSDDHKFWKEYVAHYGDIVADYKKSKRPIDHMPHPEDLVFVDGQAVMVRSGSDEPAEVNRRWEQLCQLRDVLILQAEKDHRHFRSINPDQRVPIMISNCLFVIVNDALPKRFKLDDVKLTIKMGMSQALGHRELQRQIKERWAELKIPKTENLITPPIGPYLAKLGIHRGRFGNIREL